MKLNAVFYCISAGFISGLFFSYIAVILHSVWKSIIKFFK